MRIHRHLFHRQRLLQHLFQPYLNQMLKHDHVKLLRCRHFLMCHRACVLMYQMLLRERQIHRLYLMLQSCHPLYRCFVYLSILQCYILAPGVNSNSNPFNVIGGLLLESSNLTTTVKPLPSTD